MRVQGTTSLSSNSIPKVLALSAFCASYIAQNKVNIYRDFFCGICHLNAVNLC